MVFFSADETEQTCYVPQEADPVTSGVLADDGPDSCGKSDIWNHTRPQYQD
jgi:hypothetical protein